MGSTTTTPRRTAQLTGLHAGDTTAFADAYRSHLPALAAHVAARLPGDPDVVADLVHDAFTDALADPTLIDTDVLGSLRRLCDRAYTRYAWSQRRYLRAAHSIYADAQRPEPATPELPCAAEPDRRPRRAARP